MPQGQETRTPRFLHCVASLTPTFLTHSSSLTLVLLASLTFGSLGLAGMAYKLPDFCLAAFQLVPPSPAVPGFWWWFGPPRSPT